VQHPAVEVDHVDGARETRVRHQVRERPRDALAQHLAAVGRDRCTDVQVGRGDRGDAAAQVHARQLGGEVMREHRLVMRVAQQVLEGPQAAHFAAFGLLDVRSGGHAGIDRRLARHAQLHQQALAIGQPLEAAARDRVQRLLDQASRAQRGHVHQPQFHPPGARVDVAEGDMALVRRPGHRFQRQRLRQACDAAFLATVDILQPEIVDEAEAAGGIGARMDADAAQLQFRLRHHVDARQGRRALVRDQVASRRQRQLRRARRIHQRLQSGRGQAVARGFDLAGRGLRGGQRRHAQQQGQAQQGAHQAGQAGRHLRFPGKKLNFGG
jgi:hypothetical protein